MSKSARLKKTYTFLKDFFHLSINYIIEDFLKEMIHLGIKIITDSGSDLPIEIINKYNIELVPLIVTYDDNKYLDRKTIKAKEIFDGMREGKVYKTAQVPPATFEELFTQYAQKGEECIYIAFSSELSGTYQSSKMIKEKILKEYPDFKLDIINSKCASLGFGLVVYQAALMVEAGKSREEIVEKVKFYAEHMEHIFTVDDLEYLFRGGRVSKTAAFIGGLLNIKPLLDVEDGKLIPIEKIRGRKKVMKRILEIMEERGDNLENQLIGISHGDDLEAALKVKEMIKNEFGSKKFIVNSIGSAIGAHSGPGTLAIFFLNKLV